eukprot:GHRR01031825.1.p1 GENE.GHRR01031825.1~~GHRR01031825.1.p1  ORF type:complete len:163 (+),score=31.12 GHRR01031825.1:413-901(+)
MRCCWQGWPSVHPGWQSDPATETATATNQHTAETHSHMYFTICLCHSQYVPPMSSGYTSTTHIWYHSLMLANYSKESHASHLSKGVRVIGQAQWVEVVTTWVKLVQALASWTTAHTVLIAKVVQATILEDLRTSLEPHRLSYGGACRSGNGGSNSSGHSAMG